ncbi:MAG: response regulator [Symploca sp. SIO1C4]|uniref:Response regulator n=1 Tax=Symploca sp. SIO1C4 TaxID=2607765 RepID=A0A6B3ND82_9CYAN|nr:response regulator [Symploca sp. SIO1C4]NET06851.1 response regulator [Symploca sp. SIO2B6]
MRRVLLIDDNRFQLEFMATYLRQSGYSVIMITNPKEALAVAIEAQPNLIITDVVMKGLSGFELCRCLKKNAVTARLPVIICSSKDQEIDRIWGLRQGAHAYLTKPFSPQQLIRTVNEVLARANRQHQRQSSKQLSP